MAKKTTQSRSYLAEHVQTLTADVNTLGRQVAAMNATVASLLEHSRRETGVASSHRQGIREEVQALRSEQQQVSLQLTSVQADIVKIQKTVGEHETERQQILGASKLAKAISGAAWGILGFISAGILMLIGWASKWLAQYGLPPSHGGSP